MDFFKKISKTAIDTASTIGSKSAEMLEVGKLKLQRKQLEDNVEDKKIVIGDLVYSAHQQNSTANMDTLSALFAEIGDLENQIKLIDEKLRTNTSAPTEL